MLNNRVDVGGIRARQALAPISGHPLELLERHEVAVELGLPLAALELDLGGRDGPPLNRDGIANGLRGSSWLG